LRQIRETMAKAIDLELLQLLEDKLGKGTARKVAQLEKRGRRTCPSKKARARG